ncbi:MAG: hypothetical protein HY392_02915 [Candidatus Diapherotrites archaeon]|nr:hypothetical protein [Candidatus Diapherotrites archaeon]
MALSITVSDKITGAVDRLQDRLNAKQWKDHSRASFIYSAINTIHSLEQIKGMFSEAAVAFEKDGKSFAGLDTHIQEIGSTMQILERNREIEQSVAKKTMQRGIGLIADEITNTENYSSLEQKVLAVLLKTRFIVERLSILERRETTPDYAPGKGAKKILELLEEKEKELQLLRGKYEEIRKHSYLARIEDNTSQDMEKDISILSRRLGEEQKLLQASLESHRRSMEQLEQTHSMAVEKHRTLEELELQLGGKMLELSTALKKERDYAKRIVLDIENETLKLRNAYSKQILSLEEEKTNARSQAQEDFRKKISFLSKQLAEKQELVDSLKEIISTKDKYIQRLEGKKREKNVTGKPRKTTTSQPV